MNETTAVVLVAFAASWAAAAAFIWLLVRSIRSGVWHWRTLKVIRDEQPFTFWVGPACYAAMAALLLWLPVNVASWIL
jgi:hypothetical protein